MTAGNFTASALSSTAMDNGQQSIRRWLMAVMAMILLMVAVGGITRLTESGLSMVTWEPILGAIPPRNEAEWVFRFEQYKQFPEYQQLRRGMTLHEFKVIYFWEYLHRLLGRLLGLVYAVPLAYFWLRGRLSARLKRWLFAGLVLGGAQGFMGWYMVKSGLSENPYVSHYRLAAHLGLAFFLFVYLQWIVMKLNPASGIGEPASPAARRWAYGLSALLVVQILWGAFVAGLNAGFMYNTFPTMQGHWLPPSGGVLAPWWRNLVDNPVTVQWMHRVFGTLLIVATLTAWWRLRGDPTIEGIKRTALHRVAILMVCQFWLGVFTLVLMVPVAWGAAHQVLACILLGGMVHLLFTWGGAREGFESEGGRRHA